LEHDEDNQLGRQLEHVKKISLMQRLSRPLALMRRGLHTDGAAYGRIKSKIPTRYAMGSRKPNTLLAVAVGLVGGVVLADSIARRDVTLLKVHDAS
jgi:hypothetical protein